jgi:hypothetical protein
MITDGVSELLGHILGVSSPHQNRGKNLCQYVSAVFDVQPPRSPNHSPLDFYLWGNLKARMYSAAIENEEKFDQRIFDACQTIRSRSGTFERMRGSMNRRVHTGID